MFQYIIRYVRFKNRKKKIRVVNIMSIVFILFFFIFVVPSFILIFDFNIYVSLILYGVVAICMIPVYQLNKEVKRNLNSPSFEEKEKMNT